MNLLRLSSTLLGLATAGLASAQIPDLLNSLDPGGRSMGAGGAMSSTNADTLSAFYNPAGLGYLDRTQFSIAYRNLPESATLLRNTLENPRRDSRGVGGSSTVSHLGWAFPFSRIRRGVRGTFALAYTLGGTINDTSFSQPGVPFPSESNVFSVTDYVERRRARADFFTAAYGRTNASQTLSYGIGVNFLQQRVEYAQSGTGQPNGTFSPFSLSSNGSGVGAILGVQYVPPRSLNTSLAASVSTPIDLSNNRRTSQFYDRVPGRAMVGAASRREGFRNGQDFLVIGSQVEYYYGGRGSIAFDRGDQSVLGVGLEYGYQRGEATIPIRVGYRAIAGGGDAFGTRNTFTYGVGYRPSGAKYSVDLGWAVPQGGGYDMSISATYRF